MVVYCIKVQGFEFSIGTFPALDLGFLTEPWDPFVVTGDGIAGTATGILPANRIDILPAPKKVPEQFGFLIGG